MSKRKTAIPAGIFLLFFPVMVPAQTAAPGSAAAGIATLTDSGESTEENLVSEDPEQPETVPFRRVTGVQTGSALRMRNAPGQRGSEIVGRIPAGAEALPELGRQPGWILTHYCGQDGWVSDQFTQEVVAGAILQACPDGTYDPLRTLEGEDAENSGNATQLASMPVAAAFDAVNGGGEEAAASRPFGTILLSAEFARCRIGADAGRLEFGDCLRQEILRWQADIDVAFNLNASALPVGEMRLLRNEQRSWAGDVSKRCGLPPAGVPEDQSVFRLSCLLRQLIDRTVVLEQSLPGFGG